MPTLGIRFNISAMNGLQGTNLRRLLAISFVTVSIAVCSGWIYFYVNCTECEFSLRAFLTILAVGHSVPLLVVSWTLVALGSFRVLISMLSVAANVNASISEAPYWARWNRFNLLFYPKYLNGRGLEARRKAFNGFLLFGLGAALAVPLIIVVESL